LKDENAARTTASVLKIIDLYNQNDDSLEEQASELMRSSQNDGSPTHDQ